MSVDRSNGCSFIPSWPCLCMIIYKDEATELVVFVLHSLRNQREVHMMGRSDPEDEGSQVIILVSVFYFESIESNIVLVRSQTSYLQIVRYGIQSRKLRSSVVTKVPTDP